MTTGTMIQENLEETRAIMTKNLEMALARGESLRSMLEKAEDISRQSRIFALESGKVRECCSII
jgi:hypothetical protein